MNTKKKVAEYTLLAFYFSIPFSSALYRISILILCCILFFDITDISIQKIRTKNTNLNINIYNKRILYLPVVLVSWIFLSKIWTTAPQPLYAYEAWRYEKLLMIPALTYLQIQYCKNSYKQFIVAFLCGVAILILPSYLDIIGVFNWLGYDGVNFANESYVQITDQGRNLVYFRNQIVHGFMASIFCTILFILFIYDQKKRFPYLIGVFFGIFSILFLIKGRMALIGLIGSNIILLIFSKISKRKKIFSLIGAMFLCTILIISSSAIQMRLESIYKEALNYFINSDMTTSGGIRLHYWSISWNLFIQNPLLGAGGGAFREFLIKSNDPLIPQNHYHTHNEYITILSLYGIIGMGIFLWFIKEIYTGLRQIDSLEIRYSLHSVIAIFLINALTDSSLNNQWEGWTFILFTSLIATNVVLKESACECH